MVDADGLAAADSPCRRCLVLNYARRATSAAVDAACESWPSPEEVAQNWFETTEPKTAYWETRLNAEPLDAGFFTDKGPHRRRNEDVAHADQDNGIYIVSDGLGGAAAGDRAARVATDVMSASLQGDDSAGELLGQLLPDDSTRAVLFKMLDPEDPLSDPRARMELAFLVAHQGVLAEARRTGFVGMGTAMVASWLVGTECWVGHVGDCRAYVLESGELNLLTRDHSLSEALAGRISLPRAAQESAFLRSRLTQVIGGEVAPTPDTLKWEPKQLSRLLLCSDGVWGSLSEETIRAGIGRRQNAAEIARFLVDAAINAGSRDNATALVVFF